MAKKLYRSATNRMLWGVCGGLGEYFNIDATLVRIIFVVVALAGGPGILLYILLAIIVPSASVPAPTSPEGPQSEEPERPSPKADE